MKEININGFIYSTNGVEYPQTQVFPKFVCKYYNLSSYSVDAFLNNYLFASHPLQLNDIRDSHYELLRFSENPQEDFYKVFPHLNTALFREANIEIKKKLFWKTETSVLGIISLSTLDKSDLMWPHYTQEKGFMIKFNTEKLLASISMENELDMLKFAPMNYLPSVNQLSINPTEDELKPAVYYLYNAKGEKWKYEDEWRLFISKKGMSPPMESEFYSDFDKTKHKREKNNRQIKYSIQESVEQIVWGNNFISSIAKSKSLTPDNWVKIRLKKGNKDKLKIFKIIAEQYNDRFFISELKKNKKMALYSLYDVIAGMNYAFLVKIFS